MSNFAYTITITNTGEITATNLIISNTLPADVTYISGGTLISDTVYWHEPTVAPDESVQVQLIVRATRGGIIVNDSYGVRADGGISIEGTIPIETDISSGLNYIPPFPFSLVKTAPDFVNAGDLVTYTLSITNDAILYYSGYHSYPRQEGYQNPIHIQVRDGLPLGATYVYTHPLNANNYFRYSNNTVHWDNEPNLEVGESTQVHFVVRASSTLTNHNYYATASTYIPHWDKHFMGGAPEDAAPPSLLMSTNQIY
jgi:uncharacterized repeat protein (TIGR01451 family)